MAGKEVVMLWPCRVCSHNSIQHTAAHNGTLNNCNATSSVCFVYFFHNSQGQSKTCTCKLIPKVGLKHIIAMVLGREICRCIQMPSEMVYIYIWICLCQTLQKHTAKGLALAQSEVKIKALPDPSAVAQSEPVKEAERSTQFLPN